MPNTAKVLPCYENQFKLGSNTIANCETFEVSFDNGIEEWNAFGEDGWTSRLMTSKSVTITVTAKRTFGDAGNDAVAEFAFKNGTQAQADTFTWVFADGTKQVVFNKPVISVTNLGGGDATNVAPLEFEVQSNGALTVTAVAS